MTDRGLKPDNDIEAMRCLVEATRQTREAFGSFRNRLQRRCSHCADDYRPSEWELVPREPDRSTSLTRQRAGRDERTSEVV